MIKKYTCSKRNNNCLFSCHSKVVSKVWWRKWIPYEKKKEMKKEEKNNNMICDVLFWYSVEMQWINRLNQVKRSLEKKPTRKKKININFVSLFHCTIAMEEETFILRIVKNVHVFCCYCCCCWNIIPKRCLTLWSFFWTVSFSCSNHKIKLNQTKKKYDKINHMYICGTMCTIVGL